MERKTYLIDTNVAIEYIGGTLPENALNKLDEIIDEQFSISVINKIELLGFKNITPLEEIKFKQFIEASNIIGLHEEIVNTTIGIRKKYKTKLPDAIIAATAMVNKITLITRNAKDFEKIEGMEVANPYKSL